MLPIEKGSKHFLDSKIINSQNYILVAESHSSRTTFYLGLIYKTSFGFGVYIEFIRATLKCDIIILSCVMFCFSMLLSLVCSGRKIKWSRYVGTVLITAAFSVISAFVSKALTLSLLALLFTLMSGGGAWLGLSRNSANSQSSASAVPVPVYRTPVYAPLPVRAQMSTAAEMQYVDDTDELTNPYVYVNRKSLKAARSDGFGKYSSRY